MIKLIGNKLAQNYLSQVLAGPIEAQAYLVCGLPGLGKLTLIKNLVSEMHDKKSPDDLTADTDFKLVEVAEDKKDITIDQVREITDFLKLASWAGHKRVVTINNAEDMNVQAANALLKTLEEPLGRALIFLISSQPQLLLPTIRSRCQIINMTPVNNSDLGEWLKGQGAAPDKLPELLGLSQGRPGLALKWLKSKELLSSHYQLAQEYLAFIKSRDASSLLDWMQKNLVAKSTRTSESTSNNVGLTQKAHGIIDIWLEITRDLILCRYELIDRVMYQFLASEMRDVVKDFSIIKLVKVQEILTSAQTKLKANSNIRLTVEWALITIKVELTTNNSI